MFPTILFIYLIIFIFPHFIYKSEIIRLYRTRLYRNSAYIEVQSAVPPDTMSIQKMIGYIETWIYRSIHHGPLNFDKLSIGSSVIVCNILKTEKYILESSFPQYLLLVKIFVQKCDIL